MIFSQDSSLVPFWVGLLSTNKSLYPWIVLLEADHLVTIYSTVPLHCMYPQRFSCRPTQGMSSGLCHIHHHKHIRILRASRSFHNPNDDITDGLRDAHRLHFTHRVSGISRARPALAAKSSLAPSRRAVAITPAPAFFAEELEYVQLLAI
ncbi:hypothetical protein PoB_002612500 [Plakobranchus ocellatus]|uniref:Uncharacterized protein n=1 Tax=Plakobranchus ocellatus TaxID=259542 RepID=A0AAV3ZUU6_9GAST|nr:hypothetical protein PoB_002612500 [Plakobranchus ocellatus]